jgi:hypothetical protein
MLEKEKPILQPPDKGKVKPIPLPQPKPKENSIKPK